MKLRGIALLASLIANIANAEFADKYETWVLGNAADTAPQVAQRTRDAKRSAKRAKEQLAKLDFAKSSTLYDSRKAGADADELHLLITQVLPLLSLGYRLFDDVEARDLALRVFDRLHDRGFRAGMRMPWKPQQAEGVTEVAVIVDFELRVAGYALATFLMRDALREQRTP